jgi:ribosome-associated translation inhibitor RaiA
MPNINPALLADYREALQDLYDQLVRVCPAAATLEAKDAIRGLTESIFDILTTLNRADIASNTPQYAAIETAIRGLNQQLQKMQGRMDDWIHVVSVSEQVTHAIGRAIDLALKVSG